MNYSKPIICAWDLEIIDSKGHPVCVQVDIVDGPDLFIIGDNVLKYSNHITWQEQLILEFKRPRDRMLHTFISCQNDFKARPKLMVTSPPMGISTSYYSSNILKDLPDKIVARLHSYSHVSTEEMRRLCRLSGINSNRVDESLTKVVTNVKFAVKLGDRYRHERYRLNTSTACLICTY